MLEAHQNTLPHDSSTNMNPYLLYLAKDERRMNLVG